ncbi:MAG: helix-turn-helix domain-containing protein [Burkholderiaceae bacterium]|nr:helix-turn-helix domain-containing protein [Burkholderiaceae bacterium]
MTQPPQRCALLLLPGFALSALAGVVEALQAANALLALPGAAPAYALQLVAAEGPGPVAAAGGVVVQAQPLQAVLADVGDAGGAAALWVVVAEGAPPPGALQAPAAALLALLRRAAAAGHVLAGVGGGAAWLAEAGLLRGHRATVHWPQIGPLAERHPEVLVSQRQWEIDRQRLTAAGHQAGRDLFVAWLGRRHGERLAQELAAQLGLAHVPAADERQSVPLGARLVAQQGGGSAKLAEAVALMEANLAEPLPTEEIARLVGVSRRQLERLFKQHLDALPSRWYIALRLARAQRLLRQTPQSVLQIALGCGFASGPHFSNAYRAHFGRTPREERSPRAAAWRSGEAAEAATDPCPDPQESP